MAFRLAFVNATLRVLPFDSRVVIFNVNAVYSNGQISPFNTSNTVRFAGAGTAGIFAQTGAFAAAGRRLQAGRAATVTGVDVWYGVIALVPHASVEVRNDVTRRDVT